MMTDAHRQSGTARPDDAVLAVAWVVAAILVTACVWMSFVQVRERGAWRAARPERVREATGVEGLPGIKDGAAARKSLYEVLPKTISGFRTAARHDIPGFEGVSAEAIYTPNTGDTSLRTPLNCYVGLWRIGETDTPENRVAALLRQYPVPAEPASSAPPGVIAAGTPDGRAYAMAWSQGGFAIVVDSRFTVAVPQDRDGLLEAHGQAVADSIRAALEGR